MFNLLIMSTMQYWWIKMNISSSTSADICSKCRVVDVPGTPSLIQIKADNDDNDEVTLKCVGSFVRSKPSRLAPRLQTIWIVDGQPANHSSSASTITVAPNSGLTYICITRELGSRLHSLPSNRLLMLTALHPSSCDACKLGAVLAF